MIYNQPLIYDKILVQRKQEYLNGFTFIPIKYNNEDIIIQTPKLFIPFKISSYNNKRYLDLSFQNHKNDINIKLLINNVVLPTFGGETSFDIVTYFRGMKMDENLDCCRSGEPGAGMSSFRIPR